MLDGSRKKPRDKYPLRWLADSEANKFYGGGTLSTSVVVYISFNCKHLLHAHIFKNSSPYHVKTCLTEMTSVEKIIWLLITLSQQKYCIHVTDNKSWHHVVSRHTQFGSLHGFSFNQYVWRGIDQHLLHFGLDHITTVCIMWDHASINLAICTAFFLRLRRNIWLFHPSWFLAFTHARKDRLLEVRVAHCGMAEKY